MRAMFHSYNRRPYSSQIYATISGKLYSRPFLEYSGIGEKEFVDGLNSSMVFEANIRAREYWISNPAGDYSHRSDDPFKLEYILENDLNIG